MPAEIVATTSACRIERIIRRHSNGMRTAEFEVHLPALEAGKTWLACDAVVDGIDEPTIQVPRNLFELKPQQAAALATSIQMAIDWIAQETRPQHVCGLSGFGQSIYDKCDACRSTGMGDKL